MTKAACATTATGAAQFCLRCAAVPACDTPVSLVKREHLGDWDLYFILCDEIRQFCEHTGIGGVTVAGGFAGEFLDRGEVDDRIHALRRHAELGHGELHIAATEEVQEGVDKTVGRGGSYTNAFTANHRRLSGPKFP
jgi:hypothetical protein